MGGRGGVDQRGRVPKSKPKGQVKPIGDIRVKTKGKQKKGELKGKRNRRRS